MPLFAKSYQDLMTDSILDLGNNTNITRLSAGGIARGLLEAVNKRLSEAYTTFDLGLARSFVSSAPGEYLELLGILLGVTKEIATSASTLSDEQSAKFYVATGTFGDINSGNDILIPQGTILGTDFGATGLTYRTIEQVSLPKASNLVWISIEASSPGEGAHVGSNTLVYHNCTNYTSYLTAPLLCTNVYPIANGKNFESDANFRYRLVNRVTEAEAANYTAIRLAVLSTPGVADAIITPRYRGIGTVGVILKSTLPTVSSTLIDEVTANVRQVQAYGDLVFVRKPLETGLSMALNIYYSTRLPADQTASIESSLESYIRDAINSLDIGSPFYVNSFISGLFSVDSNISNVGEVGLPIKELYMYKETILQDNKVRQRLIADYTPATDERVIIEPSLATPITFTSNYARR